MARPKKKPRRIGVIDFETDPFMHGRDPKPFAAGFFDGEIYRDFWGDDCVERLAEFCCELEEEYYIFAHNGGKFDFLFFVKTKLLEGPIKIINGRIVSAKLGKHILRDSYAFMPIALKMYAKEEIDYALFESDKRQKNKKDILHYLAKDCEYLFELVTAFVDRFGVKLTIGGTAMTELKKMHSFWEGNAVHDGIFRDYYFGGRVECFEYGLIKGNFKIIDVNSMYPYVMSKYVHPTGGEYYDMDYDIDYDTLEFDDNFDIKGFPGLPYFISFTGANRGALPVRTKMGLDFNVAYGRFDTTSHEFKVAMRLKLIDPDIIHRVLICLYTINFDRYVDHFSQEKIEAKRVKDKTREIFSKFLLNSAYGKFGQNPDNYYDYKIIYDGEEKPDETWEIYEEHDSGVELWKRKSVMHSYYDVAIAASITGAARSVLLEAKHKASRVIYCDTDSLICEDYEGDMDSLRLGAWDLEARCDTVAIAGKKMYAAFLDGECVKYASKGAQLSPADIVRVAHGEIIEYKRDAPNIKMSGEMKYITRQIRSTIKI